MYYSFKILPVLFYVEIPKKCVIIHLQFLINLCEQIEVFNLHWIGNYIYFYTIDKCCLTFLNS